MSSNAYVCMHQWSNIASMHAVISGSSIHSRVHQLENLMLVCPLHSFIFDRQEIKKNILSISRLMVVSCEAKKEQSKSPKTKCATNYCVSFTRANVFVIWRHNHSQSLDSRQLLNPNCRRTIFFPTLTNTPKIKAISEVVCRSQHLSSQVISFSLFFWRK